MRRFLFLGLVIAVSLAAQAGDCDVQAYFVSPAVDEVVRLEIISAIDAAQDSLLIAMYSFTDDQIGAAVIRAEERGVKVYILLDDGQDSAAQGREYPKLRDAGIPIGVEHVSGLLHDKFAVIDGELVITGSYNWTDGANDANFENAVFIACPGIAQAYTDEFVRIANGVLGLGWPIGGEMGRSTSAPCAECLARINGAARSNFEAVDGIGEELAGRLLAAQPYTVSDCSRAGILAALEAVDGIGPVKADAILSRFCPGLE